MDTWGALEWSWAVFTAVLAFLMWASQVNPKQVVSNLSEWAGTFGMNRQTAWLKSPNADWIVKNVAGAGLTLMALAATFLFLGAGSLGIPQKCALVGGFGIFTSIFLRNLTQPTGAAVEAIAPSQSQKIPLLEAATQAYEQTRGTLVGHAAEARIGKEDRQQGGTLTWCCYALADRLTIFGNWPPSRILEKIDWPNLRQRYSFRMNNNGALILKEHGDDGYFDNLHVLASELPNALAEVRAIAPTLAFVWPDDRGLNIHVGKDRTDYFLIVRNLSPTVPVIGVYVVREWWMRVEHRAAGGTPQRDEVRLLLQFQTGDTKDIEPSGEERFRLFSVTESGEDHAILLPSREKAEGYNAGTGTFQFQVRARAQNGSSMPDVYQFELAPDGGFAFDRKSKDVIEV